MPSASNATGFKNQALFNLANDRQSKYNVTPKPTKRQLAKRYHKTNNH
jgi:hypothetical protein